MSKIVSIRGVIVPSDYQEIYDFYGIESVSPAKVKGVLDALPEDGDESVDVYINSPGGVVNAGSEIYSLLRTHRGNVRIHVIGDAASAASLIMCAGQCDISPAARVMIHNTHGGACGDHNDLTKESGALKVHDRSIAEAYALKTGLSVDRLLKMMEVETWLTAQDAVDLHFCDSITGANEPIAAASCQLLPEAVIQRTRDMLAGIKTQRAQAMGRLAALREVDI